ncbi:11071_t:CDS:1 [Ambispora gerdemannii]|uniref:11071_t:CDS:1 n=1 Tax=Ambispora gerdemannii TaxID=144530 RepID=A0A9N8UW22_9GLOM|nr:11071_t:CDS:1 [Ambispora gerdemannii]
MNTNEYLTETERQLLNEPPYELTLTIEELTKPAKKKSDNSDKPPRPQNSWIIFRKDCEANLRLRSPDVKQKVKHTAMECSLKWKSQPSEVKHFFKALEKIAHENHKHIYPNYKYKPKNAKDLNYKKFIFREQKKYPTKSSTSVSSRQGEASPSFTSLTTRYNSYNYRNNTDINITTTDNHSPDTTLRPVINNEDGTLTDNFNADNHNNSHTDTDYLFDANYDNINNDNDNLLSNSTLIASTNATMLPTTPLPHEYINYDAAFSAGNLSNINFDYEFSSLF